MERDKTKPKTYRTVNGIQKALKSGEINDCSTIKFKGELLKIYAVMWNDTKCLTSNKTEIYFNIDNDKNITDYYFEED